jgi:hypothetical protein
MDYGLVNACASTHTRTQPSGHGRWIAAVIVALIVVVGPVLLAHSGGGFGRGGGY